MAIMADVVAGVRSKLRDFPRTFQCDIQGDGLVQICELPVVMVEPVGLLVQLVDSVDNSNIVNLTNGTHFTLDDHHGDLVLVAPLESGTFLNIIGKHYTWFTDADILGETLWWTRSLDISVMDDFLFSSLTPDDPRLELTVRGVLVGCLWALLIELSMDIDTRTPEGIDIPVTQRFAQVEKLVEIWTARYEELAHYLNLGIDRIEMLTFRRVSYTTGRLVPLYQEQEFDDMATPQRVYPIIDHDQFMGNPPTPTLPSGTDLFI